MDKYERQRIQKRMDYCKERDKAFLSLDEKRIRDFCRKWSINVPKNDVVFWAGVHKAICNMNAANAKQKLHSLIWLTEHGFKPEIELEG